ncbi:MAG: PAS domain S-box protein [Gammaproteobacteria bacterium]|nr:MAG: PAS domain S-box protein [Gammaproteobacteria bacterium]
MTRVLVVDDRAENLYVLRILLTAHGYEVMEARQGVEALTLARQSPPHLIISDLLMPTMDGYTLLRHWKADDRLKVIPFVVYTATYTEPRDEQLALDLGADAFIIKPAEPPAFMAQIEAVLERHAHGELAAPHTPKAGEKEQLREYSETLVRKIETKMIELVEANRAFELEVAERRRAEAALQAKHEELENLYATTPVGLALMDRNFRFVRINEQMAAINGKPVAAHLGRTIEEVLPELTPVLMPIYRRVLDCGESVINVEIHGETPAEPGVPRDWLASYHPLSAAGGSVSGISIAVVEITGQKRAEAALRESEEKFVLLFEKAPFPAGLSRLPDGVIVEVNQAFERVFGFTRQEAVGKTSVEMGIYPRETRERLIDEFEARGSVGEQEAVLRTKSGEERIMQVSADIVEFGGRKHILTTMQDITVRKQAEHERQKFFLLAESSSEFIGMCDLDLKPHYVNPAGISMVGLADMAAACRVKVQDYFFPEDQQFIVKEFFPRVMREGHGDVEIRLRHFQNGEPIWMFYYLFTVCDASGTPVGWATVSRDITERKQAEAALTARTEELQALASRLQAIREEERTAIAREIHDVLAQELTRLKIDIAWVSKRVAAPLDEPTRDRVIDKLKDVTAQTDAAIRTVQKIATELRPVVLDSLGLAAAIEWQVEDFEKRTDIRCRVAVPEHDPPLNRDQATACFRILQESLTNVSRHAQATQVEVKLCEEDGHLLLTVCDNGRGITREQLHDPHSIGLVGMRERAQSFGGELGITGTPGAGVTVMLRIPLLASV